MILANISNGLAFPHEGTCWFQSNHGHQHKIGYFSKDAMPWDATIELLNGGHVQIIDATRTSKLLTDAQKFGVPTWMLIFNRAIRLANVKVCEWETKEMRDLAASGVHYDLVQQIRRLAKYFPPRTVPLVMGRDISLVCYQNAEWDDKPDRLKRKIESWTGPQAPIA